jgi:hypothetical protein
MPTYIHLSNLIVTKEAIRNKYSGGIEQFRIDFDITGDNYHQEDALLFALAMMNSDEFNLDELIEKGLEFNEAENSSRDFVIYNRYGGAEWQVEWLNDNGVFAWHILSDAAAVAMAEDLGNASMDRLMAEFHRGKNPFKTIW